MLAWWLRLPHGARGSHPLLRRWLPLLLGRWSHSLLRRWRFLHPLLLRRPLSGSTNERANARLADIHSRPGRFASRAGAITLHDTNHMTTVGVDEGAAAAAVPGDLVGESGLAVVALNGGSLDERS